MFELKFTSHADVNQGGVFLPGNFLWCLQQSRRASRSGAVDAYKSVAGNLLRSRLPYCHRGPCHDDARNSPLAEEGWEPTTRFELSTVADVTAVPTVNATSPKDLERLATGLCRVDISLPHGL